MTVPSSSSRQVCSTTISRGAHTCTATSQVGGCTESSVSMATTGSGGSHTCKRSSQVRRSVARAVSGWLHFAVTGRTAHHDVMGGLQCGASKRQQCTVSILWGATHLRYEQLQKPAHLLQRADDLAACCHALLPYETAQCRLAVRGTLCFLK